MTTFDVARIRAQFPALKRTYQDRPVVYFDGPGGSQMAQPSIDAMVAYMTRGGANLHGVFPSSIETEAVIGEAKGAVAAFLGAAPDEVAFGPNMTTLNLAVSRALARTWKPGDNVVVTELDHRANVDPWLLAARDAGVEARMIPVNADTLTLELDALDELITPRTRVVAIGVSSNAVGTVSDVSRVAKRAHEVGAIVVVDAVHGAPHIPIDRDALDADVLLCSAYKFFGPHVGIAVIRRDLFEQLDVYKLKPAPSYIPDKLETGTQNHEGIAGVLGAIQFIASLGDGGALGDRDAPRDRQTVRDGSELQGGGVLRARLVVAMRIVEAHEEKLAATLRVGLRALPGVTLYAAPDDVRKTPVVAFRVEGMHPRAVCERMVEDYGIFVADGDFYASTLADKLGVNQSGGFVRAGLAPYNTAAEVDAFLAGIERITQGR